MNGKIRRAFLATGALAATCASWGCVADRPSRNGVFNENQYIRKAFLVRPDDPSAADPGWLMKATILATSTPNPLAALNLNAGIENNGAYVRFDVTSDKLRMINMRELSAGYAAQGTRVGEVVNAWPATSVDLKYRINLDGEKTNFFEENQELDWQQRQWVKLTLDKNDMSDLAPLGLGAQTVLNTCTDVANAATTLVPGSFFVDEPNNYMTWQVEITVPLRFDVQACADGYGPLGPMFQKMKRQAVTMTLMYSLVRAAPDSGVWRADGSATDYVPLEIGEKDPIRRKYGPIDIVPIDRDPNTGLLGGRQLAIRYNPNKPIVYYFAQGFPAANKAMFTDPGGVVDQTNQLLTDAGAKARLSFREYDDPQDLPAGEGPRQYGDIRYNFIRWISDLDTGPGILGEIGFTQFVPDPRTGEAISSSINIPDFALKDFVAARLDFYLQTIGAFPDIQPGGEWPAGPACKDGDVWPLGGVDQTQGGVVQSQHNAISTVYDKMQVYLHKPLNKYGHLGPSDFIVQQDQDFFDSFYKVLPYQLYKDPALNPFVIPEGGTGSYAPAAQMDALAKRAQFHQMMVTIDQGTTPFDDSDTGPAGTKNAVAFTDQFKSLTTAYHDQKYMEMFSHGNMKLDDISMISYLNVFAKDARHCINGQWETRAQYLDNVVQTYHNITVWHEFGHAMGLEHNFMGSLDRRFFPHYTDGAGRDHVGVYSSSLMDYNISPDRLFWSGTPGPGGQWNGKEGWGPYDQAAIAFLYANNQDAGHVGPTPGQMGQVAQGVSGQISPTAPWNDPDGFSDPNTEKQFLYCSPQHIRYSPFCRQFDFGTTPSEIVAAEIDNYEWNYRWQNYRLYRKFWDNSRYADSVTGTFAELRRFLSAWRFDWSDSELAHNFVKLGVFPPPGTSEGTYYTNLIAKWHNDMSMANQMVAAFHKAIIQQGSGERPYTTLYDPFFGDVTQQGIIVDKLLAQQAWTGLFRIDNYDVSQAQGLYVSPVIPFDSAYQSVAEDAVESMVGGQYDIFAYALPLAVSTFSQATHDINFPGRTEIRDWIGGKVFYAERDLLDYFHDMAAQVHFTNPLDGVTCDVGLPLDSCTYDPRIPRAKPSETHQSDGFNEFIGPNDKRYIWAYIDDRHAWTVVDRDRNTASYVIVRNYTNDVVYHQDDGSQGAYFLQRPIKYFLDSFGMFN